MWAPDFFENWRYQARQSPARWCPMLTEHIGKTRRRAVIGFILPGVNEKKGGKHVRRPR